MDQTAIHHTVVVVGRQVTAVTHLLVIVVTQVQAVIRRRVRVRVPINNIDLELVTI